MKVFLILLTGLVVQHSYAGNDGHGGGGVYKDGRYQTFYSAGFYTKKEEDTLSTLPQLTELMDFIEGADIDRNIRAALLLKMVPTQKRKYFSVNKDYFSDEVRARLLDEYRRATNASNDKLQIYAITDTTNGTTYLLPEFHQLRPLEQKVILYHEAIWLMFPYSSYEKIISMEMTFQAFLENTASLEALLKWQYSLGDMNRALKSIVQIDTKNGFLNGLLKDNKYIKFSDLLSEDYIRCVSGGGPNSGISRADASQCVGFVKLNVFRLRQEYPQSLFLVLFENLLEEDPNMIKFRDTYRGGGCGGCGLEGPVFWSFRDLKRYVTLNGFIDLKSVANGQSSMPVVLLRGTKKPRYVNEVEISMSFEEIIL